MKRVVQERSAGAVVFFEGDQQPEYLLLHYTAGHWDFPKGNVEPGEKLDQTVRREIWEETGIKSVEIIPGFSKRIEYHYRRNGALVHKEVTFLLARSSSKSVRISKEHVGFLWLTFSEAIKKVTFDNAKFILSEAQTFLAAHGASVRPMSLDEFPGQLPQDQGTRQ